MPGEYVSCIGCHENPSVTARPLQIVQRAPDTIKPPEGRDKPRTWSFLREIQPILQRRCSGCHDKDPCEEVAKCPKDKQDVFVFSMDAYPLFTRGDKPNLADFRPMQIQMKRFNDDHVGCYSKSYFYLQPYVRRPGPESDYYLQNPLEYHANTSPLVQMLKAGHHGVELTDTEWRRLYTWIDLNAPFWGTWTDQVEYFRMRGDRGWAGSGRTHEEQQKLLEYSHARRQYGERNFQGFWDPKNDPELDRYTYRDAERDIPKIAFEPPKKPAAKRAPAKPVQEVKPSKLRVELDAPGGRIAELPVVKNEETMQACSLLHLNRREALAYLDKLHDPAENAREAAQKLNSRYHCDVVITDGAKKVVSCENGELCVYPVKPVKQRNSTGAGDAHCAAILACRARGETLAEAVRHANEVSAKVVMSDSSGKD